MSFAPSPLLSVGDADRVLAAFSGAPEALWPAEAVPLDAAADRILREDIRADRAYPAQDRSRMDGIAILHEDWVQTDGATRAFTVAGLARAGDLRLALSQLSAAHIAHPTPALQLCAEIMTGAAVPEGLDTVIPYEDIRIVDGVAHLREGVTVRAGQFVHREGTDCAHEDVLVPSGTRLNAAHVAIAASVGLSSVRVARRPRVAVVATGDELVAVDQVPLPHQLRVSNAYALAALFAPWAEVRVHRVGDDPVALSAALRAVLSTFDMVLVSGGVSAGKFDAVPATLEALGVEQVFHKLAQKPGKPLWFGVFQPPVGQKETPKVPVFGLPGNPVSALVCARRFVLPMLWAKLGWAVPPVHFLPLGSTVTSPSRLTQYLPVRVETRAVSTADSEAPSGFETVAEPRAVNGSGDFATLGASDGFVELTPSENHYPTGAKVAFFAWSP